MRIEHKCLLDLSITITTFIIIISKTVYSSVSVHILVIFQNVYNTVAL